MELTMKNYKGSLKIKFLVSEGFTKYQYVGENCLKRGAWIVCRFRRGLDKNEKGGNFEGGGGTDIPMHTMCDGILFNKVADSNTSVFM